MSSDSAQSTAVPPRNSHKNPLILFVLVFAFFAILGYCTFIGITHQGTGDYPHFYNSGIALKMGDSLYLKQSELAVPPYTAEGGGYIYPPMLAFIFRPFAELPFDISRDIWIILNMMLFGVCTFLLASKHAGLYFHSSSKANTLTVLAISGLAFFFLYDTVIAQAKLAQTDIFLILWITLAYLAYPKRPLLAGLLISVPIAIKYVTIVFLFYFILRREYRASLGVVLGLLIGFFAPALFLGWQHNLTELQTALAGMLNMLGIGDAQTAAGIYKLTWERSVTIPSGFARFIEHTDFGFSAVLAMTAAVAAACLTIGWLLYKQTGNALLIRKDRIQGRIDQTTARIVSLEWSLLIITFLIFSPQATKRHMIMLIFPMILASTLLLVPKQTQRITRFPVLIGSFLVLLGTIFPPADAVNTLAAWRAISGLSLCIVVLTIALIWTTLRVLSKELEDNTNVQGTPTPIEPLQ